VSTKKKALGHLLDGQHESVQAVVDVVTKLKGSGSAMRLADLESTPMTQASAPGGAQIERKSLFPRCGTEPCGAAHRRRRGPSSSAHFFSFASADFASVIISASSFSSPGSGAIATVSVTCQGPLRASSMRPRTEAAWVTVVMKAQSPMP